MINSVENMPRCGRVRILKARAACKLRNLVLKNRQTSASSLSEEISPTTGVTVSAQTVRPTLHDMNLHGCRPRKKPLLKQMRKKARKKFAEEHENEPEAFWKKILWSDITEIN